MRAFRSRLVRSIALAAAVAGLVVIFLQVRAADGKTASSPFAARLDAVLDSHAPAGQAGCAAAVYQGDGVAWTGAQGLADVAHGHPITDDTVFGIGHTTEQFTITAALLLAQRGDLSLRDPLSKFLPALPPWGSTVTVEDLLHHASGIQDAHALLLWPTPDHPVTGRTVLAGLAHTQLGWTPGARSNPSDSDMVLLGLVVQAATGRSLADVLARDVFPAAGVHGVLARQPKGADVALSYQSPADTVPYHDEGWETVGEVGLHMTAKDLATWGSQYWRPTVGGRSMLTARSEITRTDRDSRIIPGKARPGDPNWMMGSLAWTDKAGLLMLHAAGRLPYGSGEDAFGSDLVVVPAERLAAAVLCNWEQPEPKLGAGEIAMELLDVVHGKRLLRPTPFW